MSLPADRQGHMIPPAADPQKIRACLTRTLAAEFDREWELVLEQAKAEKQLVPIHSLLNKWRHLAFMEMQEPGSYFQVLAKAEQIERNGTNQSSVPIEEMKAMIQQRLA